jgi:hypothetical protein
MSENYVYDKAKYHDDSIEEAGLPEEHACNHTVYFLRWLIEHDLMSEMFLTEGRDALASFRGGQTSIHQLYEWWDCCLLSDMLSDEGNVFARHYFDFEHGSYLKDYVKALQGHLPSVFHIPYSDESYRKLAPIVDSRFREWKRGKPWWKF